MEALQFRKAILTFTTESSMPTCSLTAKQKLTIKYFPLQLFTVPSVSGYIARNHNLVSMLLAIITSFFTNRIVDKRMIYPPNGCTAPPAIPNLSGATFSSLVPVPTSTGLIDVDSFPFESKRFMPVFSDLRYLAYTSQVQALIASLPAYHHQFATTCRLFMCFNPDKRAVKTHVEYETDARISVFNVTLSLSKVIKGLWRSFWWKSG